MQNYLQNSFSQIQNILNQLTIYINKINELIFQMNNLINQVNNPMLNELDNQINQMNNYMGNMNQMNYNMNNFQLQNIIGNKMMNSDNIINVGFCLDKTDTPPDNVIVIYKNLTINDLINEFLKRINKKEYINNYDKYFTFLYNGKDIKKYKNDKIEEHIKSNGIIYALTNKLFK